MHVYLYLPLHYNSIIMRLIKKHLVCKGELMYKIYVNATMQVYRNCMCVEAHCYRADKLNWEWLILEFCNQRRPSWLKCLTCQLLSCCMCSLENQSLPLITYTLPSTRMCSLENPPLSLRIHYQVHVRTYTRNQNIPHTNTLQQNVWRRCHTESITTTALRVQKQGI